MVAEDILLDHLAYLVIPLGWVGPEPQTAEGNLLKPSHIVLPAAMEDLVMEDLPVLVNMERLVVQVEEDGTEVLVHMLKLVVVDPATLIMLYPPTQTMRTPVTDMPSSTSYTHRPLPNPSLPLPISPHTSLLSLRPKPQPGDPLLRPPWYPPHRRRLLRLVNPPQVQHFLPLWLLLAALRWSRPTSQR